eukprot:PhM_4_TR12333/c0_g1_i1/m.9148
MCRVEGAGRGPRLEAPGIVTRRREPRPLGRRYVVVVHSVAERRRGRPIHATLDNILHQRADICCVETPERHDVVLALHRSVCPERRHDGLVPLDPHPHSLHNVEHVHAVETALVVLEHCGDCRLARYVLTPDDVHHGFVHSSTVVGASRGHCAVTLHGLPRHRLEVELVVALPLLRRPRQQLPAEHQHVVAVHNCTVVQARRRHGARRGVLHPLRCVQLQVPHLPVRESAVDDQVVAPHRRGHAVAVRRHRALSEGFRPRWDRRQRHAVWSGGRVAGGRVARMGRPGLDLVLGGRKRRGGVVRCGWGWRGRRRHRCRCRCCVVIWLLLMSVAADLAGRRCHDRVRNVAACLKLVQPRHFIF